MDSVTDNGTIRTFATGATRDTVSGKLDYSRALCPLVLKRYLQYLDSHRKQSDGSMRAFDNWKKGIDANTYLASRLRHDVDSWLATQGLPSEQSLEDSLCGVIFNAMGQLHEVLANNAARAQMPVAAIPAGVSPQIHDITEQF